MRFLPYTLQGRFLAGLALSMLLMGTFFAVALRMHTKELLASEAREKANLMVAHTEAIQSYVRTTLRPAVSELIGADDFIIEAMSTSYVTRHILNALNIDSGSFRYRRVSATPRNPDSLFTKEEQDFANFFLAKPGLARIDRTVRRNGADLMVMARPVWFTADCMRCHGDPEDAPAVLLNMYGSERGFGKSPGDMAGLDIIYVALENSKSAVTRSVAMFAIWFFAGMMVLFLAVQGFFNRLVVHNLRRVGDILQRVFFQKGETDVLEPLKREEEIESMVQSIEKVATHLGEARRQLSEYAENLESMVQERTADLKLAVAERKADVQLFVSLLSGLNRLQEKEELLQASLRLIAAHFGAQQAFYACGISGIDYTVWPKDTDIAEGHPELMREIGSALVLTMEKPEMRQDYWLIPIQSSGHTRGVLGLIWEQGASVPAREPSLAMAFGRQLGIALDNLDALDTLLRQNSLLDSIVEGVPDPIILVEGKASPVLANSSALSLAAKLCPPLENRPPGTPELLDRLGLPERLAGTLSRNEPTHYDITLADERSFAVALYPLVSKGGPPPRTIIHIRETTREKQLLLHMRRSEKLAVVGQLAAGIAHEINNPLGVIRCYAELLGSSCENEQQHADVQTILHHVDQAQSVLRDLLDFSRPRASEVEECELPAFLSGILELFKAKASSVGADIRLELEPDLPPIRVDTGMLEQVLVNLLLNAIAAVGHGRGCIVLSASADTKEGAARITVADNGPGIEESALLKIFDPFFTTKPVGTGTGLGLTVAFGMAQEMRGSLEVQNIYEGTVRAGVAFTVVLPLMSKDDGYV